MYLSLVWAALCDLLYFALHVTCSGTFPKPLPPRQERECLERIRQGDLSAKNTLIEHNLRLVAHIVKKYYAVSGEQEDLISIGTIGLIKAASTFDFQKSNKFSTYASKCIENEILMHFRSRRKSASDVSLSEPVDTDREGNSLTLMDIMSEEVDMVGQIAHGYHERGGGHGGPDRPPAEIRPAAAVYQLLPGRPGAGDHRPAVRPGRRPTLDPAGGG